MRPSLIRADLNGVLVPAAIKDRNGQARPKTGCLPSVARGQQTHAGTETVVGFALPLFAENRANQPCSP